ncbi:MAG: lactonase family protein [Methylacidiphilales bacterium]|nr:lactonase family protein [Candidatus Methylacidiphilales bacterium]
MEIRFLHLLLGLILPYTLSATEIPFYIGAYTNTPNPSRGIYRSTLNTGTGALAAPMLAAETANPSYLALTHDNKFLYAVNETPAHTVEAFQVESNGLLTRLNAQSTGGDSPCYVSLDDTEHTVFVANYDGGSIAAFPVKADGSLGERALLIPLSGFGLDPQERTKSRAHSIYTSAGNRFVYACDLGTDKIWSYHFDAATGNLTPNNPPFVCVPSGAGPRHLAFLPGAPFAYVVNERSMTVTALAIDKVSGALTPFQTLSSLPKDVPASGSGSAAIRIHPNGKWLYVSNRSHASITQFTIGIDGRLAWAANTPGVPAIPRDFAIDPSGRWLLAAGQKANLICNYKIDPVSGQISPTPYSLTLSAPVCLLFEKP